MSTCLLIVRGSVRTLLDELEIYQPFAVDISKMRQYREELAVAIFLTELTPALASRIRDPILGVETLPSLSSTFSRALRISTATPAAIPDESALVTSTRGRGRDGRRRGRSSLGGDMRFVAVITVVVQIIHQIAAGASLVDPLGLDMWRRLPLMIPPLRQ